MTNQPQQPQPTELGTGERMATYLGAADGVVHEAKGEHETEQGTRQSVGREEVERIIETWPDPPKRVAEQMLEKYGLPNAATHTKLFWYRNGPWKRTELTSDVVAHNFPAPHTDFLTQVIDYAYRRRRSASSPSSTAALWSTGRRVRWQPATPKRPTCSA